MELPKGPYVPPDWYRTYGLDEMCPGCGEDRIVTVVDDAFATRRYCGVCSTEWGVVIKSQERR
jgi:formate dehydrogenase maturation protein FdhE